MKELLENTATFITESNLYVIPSNRGLFYFKIFKTDCIVFFKNSQIIIPIEIHKYDSILNLANFIKSIIL